MERVVPNAFGCGAPIRPNRACWGQYAPPGATRATGRGAPPRSRSPRPPPPARPTLRRSGVERVVPNAFGCGVPSAQTERVGDNTLHPGTARSPGDNSCSTRRNTRRRARRPTTLAISASAAAYAPCAEPDRVERVVPNAFGCGAPICTNRACWGQHAPPEDNTLHPGTARSPGGTTHAPRCNTRRRAKRPTALAISAAATDYAPCAEPERGGTRCPQRVRLRSPIRTNRACWGQHAPPGDSTLPRGQLASPDATRAAGRGAPPRSRSPRPPPPTPSSRAGG